MVVMLHNFYITCVWGICKCLLGSIHLFVCPSVWPSICPLIIPSVHTSIRSSISRGSEGFREPQKRLMGIRLKGLRRALGDLRETQRAAGDFEGPQKTSEGPPKVQKVWERLRGPLRGQDKSLNSTSVQLGKGITDHYCSSRNHRQILFVLTLMSALLRLPHPEGLQPL